MKSAYKYITLILAPIMALSLLAISFVSSAYPARADGISQKENVAESDTLETLFNNGYQVFKDLRNEKGIYRDSILLTDSPPYHPSSIAASGIGLMSEAIAHKKGWEPQALSNVKTTIRTMTGLTPGFHAERTANGYFRHFINLEDGHREWNSEFSTIDTAIFVTGALFAANYFDDPELNTMVAKLYHSIDFGAAIADPETGGIYMIMNADGTGDSKAVTYPYNEYIIVAWLAYNQNIDKPQGKAAQLWKNKYATPANLLTKDYQGLKLLTDGTDHYMSSFTLLFPYYMVNMFSKSDEYKSYMINAYKADKLWAANEGLAPYEWGNGAGTAPAPVGYHADSIDNNEFKIVSPQIISGFLPINPSGTEDLLNLYKQNKGVYSLQSDKSKKILWRYSLTQPDWQADSVQGIDYSTFLFGLASRDATLGTAFFQKNNDFYSTANFNLNGGTGETPAAQNLVSVDLVQAPTNPTRPGYTFTGWNTRADGNGVWWDFSKDTLRGADITLFAQWQAVSTHTVTFDVNGGNGAAPGIQNIAVGSTIQEPKEQPTRPGYTFAGWSTKQDPPQKTWNFAIDTMPDNDIVLYAVWKTGILPNTGGKSGSLSNTGQDNGTLVASAIGLMLAGVSLLSIRRTKLKNR